VAWGIVGEAISLFLGDGGETGEEDNDVTEVAVVMVAVSASEVRDVRVDADEEKREVSFNGSRRKMSGDRELLLDDTVVVVPVELTLRALLPIAFTDGAPVGGTGATTPVMLPVSSFLSGIEGVDVSMGESPTEDVFEMTETLRSKIGEVWAANAAGLPTGLTPFRGDMLSFLCKFAPGASPNLPGSRCTRYR
jgi:hypothetical protein